MSKRRVSVFVREQQDKMLSEIVRESEMRDDLPTLNRSEAIRKLIDSGLESSDLSDLVDDCDQILHQRERFIEREARLNSLRAGFEARAKRHLKKRFEQGIRLSEIDDFAAGLKRDAEILWPDDQDRVAEAKSFVDEMRSAMIRSMEDTEHDPLDPEQAFEVYDSVAEAIEQQEDQPLIDEHRDEIVREYRERYRASPNADHAAIIDALAKDYPLDPESISEIIEQADPDPDDRIAAIRADGGDADE